MKKRFLQVVFVLLPVLFVASAQAATYTSTGTGSWTVTTNWMPVAPVGGPTWNDVVIIQSDISLAPGTYSGSGSVTIGTNGKLTITGNLTITGSSTKLIVNTSGSLIVTGTLRVDNAATFTLSGGTATAHTMTFTGGKYVGNSGTTTVTTGGLVINSGGATSFDNIGGIFVVNTGSNAGNVSASKFTNAGTFTLNNGNFTFENDGGTFSNSGTVTVGGLLTQYATFNNSGTLTAGSLKTSGGTLTNTGFLTATTASLSGGIMQLSPGGLATSRMTIKGALIKNGFGNITVGNGTPGTPAIYADLVIEGTATQSDANITVACNGRVAVFGDLNIGGGGGLNFTISNCGTSGGVPVGGQVYVDGDGSGNTITNTSSGGAVNNNNPNFGTPSTPYGLYVNGPVSGPVDSDRATVAQMQSTNPSFAAWVAGLPNSPLPVKIAYFKSAIGEQGILLEWATSMEKNFSHFEVQRAGADLAFSNIGIVQGRGGLAVKTTYTMLDDAPTNGKNYYRLKAVDFDGSSEFFKVIAADWSGTEDARVYPNPAIDKSFTIDIGDLYNESVSVVVYEARGYIVYSADVISKATTVILPENLSSGVYLVRLSSSSKQQVIRLVVN